MEAPFKVVGVPFCFKVELEFWEFFGDLFGAKSVMLIGSSLEL